MKKENTKENKEFLEGDAAKKEKKNGGKNKKAIIAAVAVLLVVAIALGIVFIPGMINAKVPGKNNDDEVNKEADSISLIQEGDVVQMEDVTAITGATAPDGTVTDNKGILDKEGHKIYSTGQKDANGLEIYTTGKMDSKGNILYTKNQTNSFGSLLYYTGMYDSNGKLILSPTTEQPDYSTNEKPNPYKPEATKPTVTAPLDTESDVTITGMAGDYTKFFGGKGVVNFNAVAACDDGGYVVAAYSQSYDGDFTGVSKDWAGHSAVIKYDAQGNVLWKFDLGGDADVWFNDIL